ncbi:MAG: LEPR-XLL domain-containing protein, partial [Deltaproteobacteria bacterium]
MKRSRKSGIPYWAYWGRKGNQPVRRADAPRKVHFEPLEQRVLLSGDFNYAAAQGAALDVMLRLNEGSLEVLDNATRGVLASQALAETDRVVITGAELGDAVTINYATPFDTPVLFDGGDQAGSAGDLLRILGEAGKIVRIGAGDGASISVSNVEEIFGGTGADTLIGPDADATWAVTGAGSGTVA